MYEAWLMVAIILIIIELATINLTTIWFIISALITMFLSFVITNIFIQFSIFVLLGIVLLITTKPILLKYFDKSKIKTNVYSLIGTRGIVIEDIRGKEYGVVKVEGKIWTAFSEEEIKKDTYIKVVSIKGNKLEVKKEEE